MESKFYAEDKLIVFKITDEIDDHSVQMIRRRVDYEIERYIPRKVVLDFNQVSFMDSAGIGLILGRYNQLKKYNGNLYMSGVSKQAEKIFNIAGIWTIMNKYDNVDQVLKTVGVTK